ncbi:unnamed protein product [marine sediment metagenome]|uniref:Uncharacterized protein n=1 Tax=marine sediment metagenome TaxID=412755 RepID=X1G2I4_9ZZZZ
MDAIENLKKTIQEAAKQHKERCKRLKDAVKESKESRQKQTG